MSQGEQPPVGDVPPAPDLPPAAPDPVVPEPPAPTAAAAPPAPPHVPAAGPVRPARTQPQLGGMGVKDAPRVAAELAGEALSTAELDDDHLDEEMPRVQFDRRSLILGVVFILGAVAFFYFVLPQLSGLEDTWNRLGDGDPWWLALAFAFSVLSFAGYVGLFQGVYVTGEARHRIGYRESYQITMAGLAATRLFAAGGAGGIALTAWALRRSGMSRRDVADRSIAFLVLTYAVYMAALVLCGYGLRWNLLEGPAPFGVTVIPAVFGLAVITIALLMTFVPADVERRFERWAGGSGRLSRVAVRLSTVPAAISSGVRIALRHIGRRDPALVGVIAYWGFNIAILWACFHAFGEAPPWAVIVMAYFVGMLGNLLPLPGGVGGVDGGMIGAFVAFGVGGSLALVAVLAYRVFAFWLPTIPGIVAYFQLRRTVAGWREQRADGAPALDGAQTA
ncbi:flippase-like domain-containing protein [Conexibacter sp. W3-3-2]|uniref:Flippase-like domain-containing protein n=1 Tax=Paraconexibacter algicola TaxID=2133960 RepID=A0A2T4UEY3_9ACTN|nr:MULTISPECIES: lysylphosphatidylglycerol synthase transmembrane domain-containing protein [Solirubrobacterales]MTD47105.1 flippase-like domain-containing protein [Conexibacter sp. W3-3-2]PTL56330.1 hypothetical protein C7Y72_15275 [Paraconexibacter algicola]